MQGILQAATNFITGTLGISLITAALAVGVGAWLCRMCYFHTVAEIALAGAALMGIVALANAIY